MRALTKIQWAQACVRSIPGSTVRLRFRCNLCGQTLTRRVQRSRLWIASYCGRADRKGRLYRVNPLNPVFNQL
jgi:hypothetical protein